MSDQRHRLSWALVVATYDRPQMLRVCIQQALAQERAPEEIVVVDAGSGWETLSQELRPVVEARGIAYRHVAAEERSLPVQRNQGVALARADVVFLLDDDSLMHRGCAEAVMAVYDADPAGEVVGVQASLHPDLPHGVGVQEPRKATGVDQETVDRWLSSPRRSDRAMAAVWRRVLLMDAMRVFIPYDGTFHERVLPATLADLHLAPAALLQGCRMTFRRGAVVREKFSPLLLSYSPGEDLDGSYRISRHGVMLTALDASLHHFQSARSRVDRRRATTLAMLNQAALIRVHSTDLTRDWRHLARLNRRRLLAEAIKDLLSRRWSLPQLRGVLAARPGVRRIRSMTPEDIAAQFPAMQRAVLKP